MLGLLGPNGAGKTTAVRCLTTLLRPDSGKLTVAGLDVLKQPNEVRRSIGLSGQFAAVDEYLTGRENLQMVGRRLPDRRPRPRRPGPTNCSTSSTSPTPPTARPRPTPAVMRRRPRPRGGASLAPAW
ncbi:ATP-binding cassette domain-containing protein [Streptomyces sp. L7]